MFDLNKEICSKAAIHKPYKWTDYKNFVQLLQRRKNFSRTSSILTTFYQRRNFKLLKRWLVRTFLWQTIAVAAVMQQEKTSTGSFDSGSPLEAGLKSINSTDH